MRSLAVIGGGWAGIAAAVEGTERGHAVTLFEMAPHFGGRARSLQGSGLDNGQHILIGAYRDTLALMRRVGVDPDAVLARRPLALVEPDGRGLQLPAGPPIPAFLLAVLRRSGWRLGERLSLLAACMRWAAMRFRCDDTLSVGRLTAGLPARVRTDLIEPLCVAALNTPAERASAAVFLRVLHDGLFGGPGAADLLLPRQPLARLLPGPALDWLRSRGVQLEAGRRVTTLHPAGTGWAVEGRRFDSTVLACSAAEAARLAQPLAPDWARLAGSLAYEPIVTVYLKSPGARLAQPMIALRESDAAPAQFVFDHGLLGGEAGLFAAVVSGARSWTERGLDATSAAVLAQLHAVFPAGTWTTGLTVVRTLAERRATFACTPGLRRPPSFIAPGLHAAGDHVEGPYPATLEGAVRSGLAAVAALDQPQDTNMRT